MLDIILLLTELGAALLYDEENEHFIISTAVEGEDEEELDPDQRLTFNNWRDLASFCTEVGIATHTTIRQALRDVLTGASDTQVADEFSDLGNFRYWTVSVGRHNVIKLSI